MKEKIKVGFLFGAGAEYCYGCPSGNDFAINLFLEDHGTSELKKQLNNLKNKEYKDWLPSKQGRITGFTTSSIHKLLSESLHTNREKIQKTLIKKNGKDTIARIQAELSSNTNDTNERSITIDGLLWKDGVEISVLLSEIITLAQKLANVKDSANEKEAYQGMLKFIYGLIYFSYGHSYIDELNMRILPALDDSISWLDCGNIFSIDSGEAFIKEGWGIIKKYNADKDIAERKSYKAYKELFSCLIDYRALIDEYWHYLYTPKEEWGKFCRIASFLFGAAAIFGGNNSNISEKTYQDSKQIDYYKDISNCQDIDIVQIATTNYTSYSQSNITSYKHNVMHLNGSLEKMYDPYKNEIVKKSDIGDRFVVPWIYTQSGTKPMTDIKIMKEYVDTYENFSRADALIVIGYGFNEDDYHVNSMIRGLIQEHGKKVILIGAEEDKVYKALRIKNSLSNQKLKFYDYEKLEPTQWITDICTDLQQIISSAELLL